MCVSLAAAAAITAAAATVAGTAVSIGSAKANAAQQKIQLDLQRKQIQEEREAARIQAAEAEAMRVSDYEQWKASQVAMEAATGTRSESFLQGIDASSRKALALDLSNIRSGYLTGDIAAMRGIRVNRMTRQAVGIASTYQQIGAVASGIGSLASIGQSYAQYKKGT
jgi:predicted DNA-binding protein (UPF0251 family)